MQQGVSRIEVTSRSAVTPFDVVIGNTHPDSDEGTIIEALRDVSKDKLVDMKLETDLEIIYGIFLTKPRDDGSKSWSKSWRMSVPQKFRDHMYRQKAIPAGGRAEDSILQARRSQ